MKRLLATFALAAFTLLGADMSGTWNFAVTTDAGNGEPTFVLKQDGEKLTGDYSGTLGSAKVKGTVKGSDVVIQFTASDQQVVYTGKLEGDDHIKGKVQIGSLASGTFTGSKTKK